MVLDGPAVVVFLPTTTAARYFYHSFILSVVVCLGSYSTPDCLLRVAFSPSACLLCPHQLHTM